jgi:hypothetical protein
MVPAAKAACCVTDGFWPRGRPDEVLCHKRHRRWLIPLARKGLTCTCHVVRPLLQDNPALCKQIGSLIGGVEVLGLVGFDEI